MVLVHLQEQRLLVAVVRDLVSEDAGGVRAPSVEIAGGDADVAELLNFVHQRPLSIRMRMERG